MGIEKGRKNLTETIGNAMLSMLATKVRRQNRFWTYVQDISTLKGMITMKNKRMHYASPDLSLIGTVLGEPADFFQNMDSKTLAGLKDSVDKALSTLPDRNKKAVELRFGLIVGSKPQTLKGVGLCLDNVSPERARQIISKSLRMLRHPTRIRILIRFTPLYDPVKEMQRLEEEKRSQANLAEALARSTQIKVSEVDWSVRTFNVLIGHGIPTLSELCKKTEAELLGYKNFGIKSLREIKEKLEQFGLRLGLSHNL